MTERDETARTEGVEPDLKWIRLAAYAGIIAWVTYLLVEARSWGFEDGFLPRLVGVPVIALSLVQLVKILFPQFVEGFTPEAPSTEDDPLSESASERTHELRGAREVVIVAWILVLPVLLYVLGFFVGIFAYVFLFRAYYSSSIVRSIAIAGLVSAFIHVLFTRILSISLWDGIWGIAPPF